MVDGLTTATSIWVTAAIGAASDADLPILAALTTGIYFVLGQFAGVESSVTWRDWRW